MVDFLRYKLLFESTYAEDVVRLKLSQLGKRAKESLRYRWLILVAVFVALVSACATNPSPDPSGPRSDAPTYPVLLLDEGGDRRDAALAAWSRFTLGQGITNAPQPELQNVTSTLNSIPALSQPLYLPRIGDGGPMNEEETREALRRLITEGGPLLCGESQQISLIQRVDGADGVKEAVYQQRPFRYPLKRGYGQLRIGFMPDRRIVRLSSTCIPDTDRLRRGFAGIGAQRISSEKAIASVVGRTVNYTDKNGQQQVLTVPASDKLTARELVVYPIERQGEEPALEFHIAWELTLAGGPVLTLFVDSLTGDVLGVE